MSWRPSDIPDLSGRTAVVTGATSGLGLHTALELARHGARVLMTCRSAGRGEAALTSLRAQVPDAQAELLELDLASLASVERAAGAASLRVGALDLLVLNAGLMAVPRQWTEDGFELQLGTNHLGHFALAGRLLPALLAAPAPRVVSVSSSAHRSGRIAFDDLMGERSYSRWGAYGQSKLANLLFVRELHRRAAASSWPVTAVAAHPGWAATGLQSGQGAPLLEAALRVGNAVLAQSAAQGAEPTLYAATAPEVRGGEYYGPALLGLRGHPARAGTSPAARNDAAATRLWQVSEDLTGVRWPA